MRRRALTLATALIVTVIVSPLGIAATPVTGKPCKALGQTQMYQAKKFTCIKSGKKLVWSAPVAVRPAAAKPSPSPSASPLASPTTSQTQGERASISVPAPKAYPKSVGALNTSNSALTSSFELPVSVQAPPAGTNVKLWIYNPANQRGKAGSPGIFLGATGSEWKYFSANADGSFYANLSAGSYGIDVVEPNTTKYLRKRYAANVNSNGVFSITGLTSNSAGYFTMTVDLLPVVSPAVEALKKKVLAAATMPVSSFVPSSPCQLKDQVTPNRSLSVDLSAGFPKVANRLPSFGHIKALIVPVDFTDISGKDDPLTYFGRIAEGVSTFYFKQSYGQLAFDFEVVPTWIHAPFTSTKFGTGGSVGNGDPKGYLNAVIALTDGAIDYSSYDAVYYLVPKEMPMANMGWGPAITYPHWISSGVIMNGATGGADMYYVENNGIVGGTWKWMAHETGHAFGLFDEDLNHASQSLGHWSIMAMSWSNHAIELGAWDRYLQGWLPQSQVNCVEFSSLTVDGSVTKISPVVRLDKEIKTILIPVTSSKMLVIESRKKESLDNIATTNEGVLVYTVDMKKGQLGGGYEIQKRVGSTDPNFEDAALRAGDSITVSGVKINVTELSNAGDSVKISKA
jgi:M6 family metalloprotease-like protein